MTHIQFVEDGWELGADHEGLDTEQDEGNIFEMPTFVAEEFFTEGNDWSAACRSFLINEHNDRTGLKGIVFGETIDHNRKSRFDCLAMKKCTSTYYLQSFTTIQAEMNPSIYAAC